MQFEGQRDNEEVQFIFRRHIMTARKGLILLLLMVAVGMIPMFIWRDQIMTFWIWVGCVIVGLLLFIYEQMLWYFSIYIVTNQRIRQVSQQGFFKKTVVDLGLDKIQSISYNVPGLFGGMFGYGTLLIQTQVGDMTISMVSKPEKTYNKLQNVMGEIDG